MTRKKSTIEKLDMIRSDCSEGIHSSYIVRNTPVLEDREKELADLRKRAEAGDTSEATQKRIARLEEIVKNIKFTLDWTKMAMTLKRPYGM